MKKKLLLLHLLIAALFASAQNVGIGTTAPQTKLHVFNGASGATPFIFTSLTVESNGHTYINLLSPAVNETAILFGQPGSSANGVIMYNTSGTSNGFQFRNNGNQTRMVIDSTGNVGIGITTPTASLEVMRGTGAGGTAVFRGTTHISHFNYSTDENTYIRAGKDSSNVIINDIPGGKVGIGTSSPNASALLDVSSTTKGFLPPRMTWAQIITISTPAEGLMIYNTTTKQPNYYDGTEWRKIDGTPALKIGDSYEGGIIAYILQPGDPGYIAGQTHGLIAAASDQGTLAEWGCMGTAIPGADGTALGTGNQNTIDIMAGCATPGIAARICGDLVLNGYSDWYLPSKAELYKLYLNRVAVGGFICCLYWSSSEIDLNSIWYQNFGNGVQFYDLKNLAYRVRAVRAF